MSDLKGDRRRQLRLAFLGGGIDSAIGRVHRTAVEMDQRFELVAGCFSREGAINAATAQNYRVSEKRVYSDLDALVENEASRIDAIVVLTPTDQHRDQLLTCISAGLPVVSEKALVCKSADAEKLKAAIDARNGFLAVTYNYTAYPMLREMRHLVNTGAFGKIDQVHIEMPQEGFARRGADGNPVIPQDWRLRDGSISTVSLDLGIHLHSITNFVTGEKPVELVAIQNNFGNFHEIADNVLCMAKYTNGLASSIWYSKAALGYRNGLRIRLFGKEGSAEWLQENPEYLCVADVRGRKATLDRGSSDIAIANQSRYTRFKSGHPAGFIEAFANYYCDVGDALEIFLDEGKLQLRPFVFGIDDALEGLNMLEAIATSSAEKRWISVK